MTHAITSALPPLPLGKAPVRGTLFAGAAAALLGFGGFLGWSMSVPLASAVVVTGTVQADSNRKTIQHLDGGIIRDLLVRDGDRVGAGQPLARMDEVENRARSDMLERQHWALLAEEVRLRAERDDQPELHFPEELTTQRHRPDIAEILSTQDGLFSSRNSRMEGQMAILRQRIAQNHALIAALEVQIAAGERQRALLEQEETTVSAMVEKGVERRPRLLALQRTAAQLAGAQAEHAGRIAQSREVVAEAELQQADLRRTRHAEAALGLLEVQTRRTELAEKRIAVAVRLARSSVVAPEAGTVLNLRTHTAGGVIPPGGAILDLVPRDDRLVIAVRVRPVDIDSTRVGRPALVVLTAYPGRTAPRLDGQVTHVSADTLSDERTGAPYFLARVDVPRAQIEQAGLDDLHPGMPAEVLVSGQERTLFDYLVQPLTDSFRRAFREE